MNLGPQNQADPTLPRYGTDFIDFCKKLLSLSQQTYANRLRR